MVMPCSRSARSPSTSNDRSGVDSPRSTEARCTASIWSASTDLVSYSSRPTRVDLPSSTLPAVTTRRRSVISEVPLPLAVLHRGLRQAVVGPGGTALGEPARRHLGHHLVHCGRVGLNGAGARAVAHRAVAHRAGLDSLAAAGTAPRTGGQPHPVTTEHLPVVRVVDRRQLDALPRDVTPHVELGPVGQREDPDVAAG